MHVDELVTDEKLTEIIESSARWSQIPRDDTNFLNYSKGVVLRAFHGFRGDYQEMVRCIVRDGSVCVPEKSSQFFYLRLGEALVHWLSWQPALARVALRRNGERLRTTEDRSLKILGELYEQSISDLLVYVTNTTIRASENVATIQELTLMKGDPNMHDKFYARLEAQEIECTYQLLDEYFSATEKVRACAEPFTFISEHPDKFVMFMKNIAVQVLNVNVTDIWGSETLYKLV